MKKEIQPAMIIRRLTAAISCLSTVFFAFPALIHAASGGSTAWQYWHNDSVDQMAVASTVDSQGNIIITGTSNKNGTDDFYTIKIKEDHSGILWSSTFDLAGGSDQAVAVAVDSDDNVIVTGVGNRGGVKKEMVTIKYCGKDVGTPPGYDPEIPGTPYPGLCTAGEIIWTATYDGPARGNDYPTSLAVDADKNIYVGGYGQSLTGGDDDYILLKYAPAGPSADGSPTWQRSFGGNRLDNDYITDVTTCSIPNSGQYFVAITGHILDDNGNSYIHTIKYTSAGTRLWEKTFTDKAKVNEVDPKIAMDSACNVVVAGSMVGPSSNDIFAVKYAAGNGDRLWGDGPYTFAGSDDDQLNGIYIDTNNDVFLAGMTYVNLEDDNFFIARVNGGNGHFIWEKDYDSGYWDSALSVAVDNATNSIYVLGVTLDNNNDYDFRTIKYRLADGNLLWNSSFDSAIAVGGNQNDWPIGIHLNKAGEVLVTGYIDAVVTGVSFDYYAVKYVPGLLDPPTGLVASVIASASGVKAALSWTDNSGNETGFEIHRSTKSFEISNDTLLFTTANDSTAYNDSTALPNTRYYYRVRAKEVVGSVTNLSHSSNEVTTLTTILEYNAPPWLFTKDGKGNGNDEAYGIAVGPDLNPVVTGAGVNSMHYTNFLTMKLDRSNDSRILWEDYNNEAGADLDIAYDIAIANDNSILITGTTNLFSIVSKSFDIKTLELAPSGTNDGDPRWENSFDNNPPHGLDSGTIAAYNSAGNSWAMAGYGDGGQGTDIFVAAFDRNGNPLWPGEVKTYSSNGNDYPTGMIFDANGDLIVTGICNGSGDTNSGAFDILLIKFNGSTGISIWNDTYNHQGGDGDDRSAAITLDNNNDIYITGYVTNDSSKNIYTAKYSGLTGERLWHKTYNGPANGDDTAEAIAYDKIWNGEIIVGGTRLSSANNHDFYIVRYDPVDGAIKREITLDREFDDDHLKVMGTDLSGSMCVVGATGSSSGSQDIIGVRYNWDGTYLDSMKFDGAGHDNDMPIDVATNTYGEMFVAGKSKNASNNFDYLVLQCVGSDKMVQTPFPFNITTFYTSANLSWQDTNTNEGGFEIERDKKACLESDSVAVWDNKLIKTLAPNTTSYTDLGPDEKGLDFNYETYCYRVRAISNDSIKIPSRWLYGQITTYNPPPPSNLTATKLNTTGIKLDWLDNSYGETRFVVKRCEVLNCAVNDSNFLEVGYPAADTQTWNDLSACEGTTYSYKISAKNDDSNTWGTNDSNTITNVSTDGMAAPAYLKATRSSEGRINLSWSDVNLDETGFKIFRCRNDSCTDFEEMTTLQPNPPGALAFYHLDNGRYSGITNEVLDSSGNGFHATAHKAESVPSGIRGRAVYLSGNDSYLTTNLTLDQSSAASQLTMAAWVYPASTSAGWHYVLSTDHVNGGFDWSIVRIAGTWFVLTGSAKANTGFTVDINTWQHIAAVYQNGKVVFYKNGQPSAEFATTNDSAATRPISIGSRVLSAENFDGKIDEVAIYDRALSTNELKVLYNNHLSDTNPTMARTLYLKLDNTQYTGSSNEVSDSSGNGNNATAYGTLQSVSPGLKDRAASFDGIDDYLATSLTIDQSSAASKLTMAAWVYPLSTSTGYHYIITSDNGGWDWTITREGSVWEVFTGSNKADTGFTVDINTWQHIAAVYQNGTVIFYKNGQPSASFATSYDTSANPIAIGSSISYPGYFDGRIDEVSIFDRALSTEEIKAFYTDYLANAKPDRALYLRMDESSWSGAAGEVKDRTANQLHGQSFNVNTGNGANILNDSVRGRVANFNGVASTSGGYINLGNPAVLQATGSQTIAFWINPDHFTYRTSPYYKAYDGEGAITVENSGGLNYYYGTSGNHSGASYQGFPMTEALTAGTWTHLAIVRDLAAMKLRWYKNGVMVNEAKANYSAAAASSLTAYIGNLLSGSSYYFDGKLDDFMIVNRALSATEIANLYKPATPTSYSDTNVPPDTIYRYRVSAFNNDSSCRWETDYSAVATNNSALATPATLSATVLNTTNVSLSWQDNFEFESGYVLQRCDTTLVANCDNDSDFNVTYTFGHTVTAYNDSTVLENRTYAFRVKAINTTSESWQSPPSNTVTPHTNAKAVPSNFNVSRVNEEEILLTWSTANTDQDGFQVYRCQNDSCTSFSLLKTLGTGVSTFTDKHLSPNSTYRYQVRAFKNQSQGQVNNGWTTDWAPLSGGGSPFATTTIYAPSLPTAVATSTNTINLGWNDPTGRETDYIIQRCTMPACNDSDFAQIAAVGRGVTSYTDSSSAICKSNTYKYRVRAEENGLSSGLGSCWLKKKKINFTNFIANYPMRLEIPYDSNMQTDFDDIRFYDETDQHEIPYWLENKADGSKAYVWIMTGENNNIYLYFNNPTAVSASDPGSVSEFTNSSYYEFFDNFAARRSSFDSAKWVELDGSNSSMNNKISQNNGLLLNYVSSGWDTALISQKTFIRAPGKAISAGISTYSSPSIPFMLGWEANQTTSANYNQLVHGLYFNTYNSTGKFNISEKGTIANLGFSYNQTGAYIGVDVKLTATGASYWANGGQITTTSTYADSPLRLAFHQNSHVAKIYWVAVRQIPATEPGYSFAAAETVSSCPSAHTWIGAYSPEVTVATPAASAPTDIGASTLSDSSLSVTWTQHTSDEDAFYLERCDKNYNPCPVENDSIFTPLATIKKSSYLTSAIPQELALYFDEASWTGVQYQIIDSSGKGVHGTSYGGASTVTDEVRGQVGKFDGSDDYVVIPGNTTLQHTTDSSFTFAVWVKPAKAPAGRDANPPCNDCTAGIMGRPGYHEGLYYNPDKTFSFGIYNSTSTYFGINSSDTYEPGFWYHVVGVVDNTAKKFYIYVNGAQNQTTYTGTLRDYGTNSYLLGAFPGTAWNFYYEGLIDEPRIFSKALTATEVQTLYAPDVYSYTDSGLIPGSTHTYRVKATKSSGNCDWSLPGITAGAGTTLPPPAPANFTATNDSSNPYSKINLAWKDKTNTNSAFIVERCQGAGCSDYEEKATVSGNDTTYSDIDVCPGASYSYRLKGISEVFPIGYGLSNNGDNTSWSRRKALTISNFQANYQTKLEIAWDPDMQENFNDIRFYDAIASQELSYWIEKQTNGVSATVWLKTGANNSIALYYGNPNAASSSNGDSTFTFFDDFNDGILDPVKWPTQSINWVGTYIFETAGEFKQTRYFDGYYYIQSPAFAGTATATQGFVLTARTKSNTVAPDGWSPVMWYKSGSEGDSILDYSLGRQVLRERGSWAFWSPQNLPLDLWHQNSIILKSTTAMTAKVEYETAPSRNWSYNSATTTANANYYIRMGSRHDGYGIGWEYLDGRVDWVFMRKWAATEPTVTITSEERGAIVWNTDYTYATPVNTPALSTPTKPTNVSAAGVSETAVNLTWTDNLGNEDGYLIERCQGSNCNDFNMIAKVDKNIKDDFSSGILPQYWNFEAWTQYNSDTVAPINISDASGANQLTWSNGKAVLHTQAIKTGDVNHNGTRMWFTGADSFLGNADFDIQVDYNLPNPILAYTQYPVYARLEVGFNTGELSFVERCNTNQLGSGLFVGSVWQGGVFYSDLVASSGKLRLTRVGNVLSTYAWNNDQWTLLYTPSSTIASSSTVSYLIITQYANRNEQFGAGGEDLTTELDNFVIIKKTGTFKFLDIGSKFVQPYNWTFTGQLDSGKDTAAPIDFSDYSGLTNIDITKGVATLHTTTTGLGRQGNYNRASMDLNTDGEAVFGANDFDLQLNFNITGNSCSAAPKGLAAYLKMEENSWNSTANEVLDYSGSGRHGTAYGGATIVNDSIRGKVAYFDGLDDNVISQVLTGNAIIPVAGESTLALWFKAPVVGAGSYSWPMAYAKSDFGCNTAIRYLPYANTGFNGLITSWTANDSTACTRVGAVSPAGRYNDSLWHHVASTYSTAKGENIYIDGSLVATNSSNPINNIYDGQIFQVGGSSGHWFDGWIDEARIFTKELSASDVQLLAQDRFYDGIAPIGIKIGFDSGDYLTLERAGGANGEYYATGLINSVQETKKQVTTASTGKLRIQRTGNNLSASFWNGSAWTTLQTHAQNVPAGAQVNSVQVYNQAASDSLCDLNTKVSGISVTASGTTYNYFDNESLNTISNSYSYRVSPYKEGSACTNWSTYSGCDSTIPTAVPPPTGLSTTGVTTTEVYLTWADNASSETNYEIQRCTGSACTFAAGNDTKTWTVAANVSSYPDLTPVKSTAYRYRVRAKGVGWDTVYSSVLPVTTLTPQAPTSLTVTWASEIRLKLAWTDNSVDETNFMVERGNESCGLSSFSVIATLAAGTRSYNDSPLNFNTTYCYRVRAYKNTGLANSWYSNYSNTFSKKTLVESLTLVATPSSVNTNLISLSWSDKSESETGFTIKRCKDSDCINFPAGGNATSYQDNTVCDSSTYSYQVRPIKMDISNTVNLWDDAVQMSPTVPATTRTPEAPFDFTVTEIHNDSTESKQMQLYWEYNDSDETGFTIQRCSGINCSNFSTISNQSTIVSNGTFDTPINTQASIDYWKIGGKIWYLDTYGAFSSTSDWSSRPINLSNEQNAAKVTGTGNGKVVLYSQMLYKNGWSDSGQYIQALMKMRDPGIVGSGDFDLRVSFNLPDGLISNNKNHSYLKMEMSFPDGDGDQRLNSDAVSIEYKIRSDGTNRYNSYCRINNIIQNDSSAQAFDTMGKLRIMRDNGSISTYYWNSSTSQWVQLMRHDTVMTFNLAPDNVQLYNQVQFILMSNVSITTEIEDFKIFRSSFSYTDQNLSPSSTYRYRVVPTKTTPSGGCAWGPGDPRHPSLYSPEESERTRPLAPTGLTATTIKNNTIKLEWTDNDADEDGYEIERLTWNGHYLNIYSSYDRDTIFTNNSRSFMTSASNEPGKTYTYRVRAYRGADKSAYSLPASALTEPYTNQADYDSCPE